MIVQRYERPILNYIGRMVGEREAALDFSQEVFLKVYASLDSFRPQYKFSTWLFRIASNTIIDHWRKKKLPTQSLDQPIDDSEDFGKLQVTDENPSVVRKYELQELRAKIDAALDKLPAPLRVNSTRIPALVPPFESETLALTSVLS